MTIRRSKNHWSILHKMIFVWYERRKCFNLNFGLQLQNFDHVSSRRIVTSVYEQKCWLTVDIIVSSENSSPSITISDSSFSNSQKADPVEFRQVNFRSNPRRADMCIRGMWHTYERLSYWIVTWSSSLSMERIIIIIGLRLDESVRELIWWLIEI